MRPLLSTVALLAMSTAPLDATEKYTIARQATLIVVGTMRPDPPFPWFDGWHFTGKIEVEEVLFGTAPSSDLVYRYTENSSMRDWRMFPTAFRFFYRELRAKGLWFLKPLNGKSWQPSIYFGFDVLSSRADYEAHIAR